MGDRKVESTEKGGSVTRGGSCVLTSSGVRGRGSGGMSGNRLLLLSGRTSARASGTPSGAGWVMMATGVLMGNFRVTSLELEGTDSFQNEN